MTFQKIQNLVRVDDMNLNMNDFFKSAEHQ